jgi:hypothetical protein
MACLCFVIRRCLCILVRRHFVTRQLAGIAGLEVKVNVVYHHHHHHRLRLGILVRKKNCTKLFFLVSWGGVRPSPLGRSATDRPIVLSPDDG